MNPPLVLDILIVHLPYAGNGASAAEHPDIRAWELQTVIKMKEDDRIGRILIKDLVDTPCTLVRNKAVEIARAEGVHLLMFVDSDQSPNKHAGEPGFVPFWDAAFEEVYDAYSKGEQRVVGAPYCGPPPNENVYVFQFDNLGNHGDETYLRLEQYTRAQASVMTGVGEVAALPTGLILIDMRIFDLVEPSGRKKLDILNDVASGTISAEQGERELAEGWFYYEWANCHASEKASTEDVTFTRNVAFSGIEELGYNPLRCAWDSWIGHWKPWNVGRPDLYPVDAVATQLRNSVLRNVRANERVVDLDGKGFPEPQLVSPLAEDNPNVESGNGKPLTNGVYFGVDPSNGQPSVQVEVGERDIFGRTVKTFGHETPMEHLQCLRDVAEETVGHRTRLDRFFILEVGSWVGESAVALCVPRAEMLCVDPFTGNSGDWTGRLAEMADIEAMFMENTSGLDIVLSKETSLGEAKKFSRWSAFMFRTVFDIIFLDASHDYEDTKADIEAWWPHLADDGVLLVHDYNTLQFPGVTQAVNEWFGEHVEGIGLCPTGEIAKIEKAKVGAVERVLDDAPCQK